MLEINRLSAQIKPEKTILFFGSGSSIPSGLFSGLELRDKICKKFGISDDYDLTEASQLAEDKTSRTDLIGFLRSCILPAKPTGGLLNLPLYDWHSIYTTNYDNLIEMSYDKAKVPFRKISSDFDYNSGRDDGSTRIYKLHGTIEHDHCDGHQSRIILTESDYDLTDSYRKMLWNRLKVDIAENNCVIIGYSLSDAHVKSLIQEVSKIKADAMHSTKVYALIFNRDPERAALLEKRGIEVSFGGIDEFFASLVSVKMAAGQSSDSSDSFFAGLPALNPATLDVSHQVDLATNLSRMYEGSPASYADINAGFTFKRDLSAAICSQMENSQKPYALLLGPSGAGKTTAARQAMLELHRIGYKAWEHHRDRELLHEEWSKVAAKLYQKGETGILLVDDAHEHLREINLLIEALVKQDNGNLRLILCAPRHDWNPRVKTPYIFKLGEQYAFNHLSHAEIDNLILLVERQPEVQKLVDVSFGGFSKPEKRRRLIHQCDKNTFVCLKNIFASEAFDDIILREYADLIPEYQDIYKLVAALESLGVKVHRQLVMRQTGIDSTQVNAILAGLTDIVDEYDVDPSQGVYGWRGRHQAITEILCKYKFNQQGEIYKLLESVIENLSMTYDLEARTVRNLCSASGGLTRAGNKRQQNQLLQKLISVAPGQRVPRHRLIANLIALGDISKAETEIRVFESDFKQDGPVSRYKVKILLQRALNSHGIMQEDRLVIVDKAIDIARRNVDRYFGNKYALTAFCDAGLAYLKLSGNFTVYDEAMALLKSAERELYDPDIPRLVERYTQAVLAGPDNSEGGYEVDEATFYSDA